MYWIFNIIRQCRDLKDFVTKFAESFKMSEVNIYKYIQTVRADEE